jgi:gamma-glutamyl-gamma-aminobutyrate hydrolase PuuD
MHALMVFGAFALLFSCEKPKQTTTAPKSSDSNAIGLTYWQPFENGPRYVFPTVDGVDHSVLVKEFEAKLNGSTRYKSLFESARHYFSDTFKKSEVRFQNYEPIAKDAPSVARESSGMPKFVVPVNMLVSFDYENQGHWVHTERVLEEYGAFAAIMPMGLDLVLDEQQLSRFHDAVVSEFDAAFIPPGDDVAPETFGEKLTAAVVPNAHRDEIEISFVKRWLLSEKKIFGVCRGLEIIAVAMGQKLIQDIKEFYPKSKIWHHPDRSGTDSSNFNILHTNKIRVLKESRLATKLGCEPGKDCDVSVLCDHHHAVLPTDFQRVATKTAVATAIMPDPDAPPIVEIVDYLDAKGKYKGFSVQFHPEEMTSPEMKPVRDAVYRTMVEDARSASL